MSKTTRLRRRRSTFVLASLVLVGLLSFVAIGVASGASTDLTAAQQQPTQASTYAAAKHANGSVAKTDPSLLGLTGSKLVPVMIKYAFTPTASYAGGDQGPQGHQPARDTQVAREERPGGQRATSASPNAKADANQPAGIKRAVPEREARPAADGRLRRRRRPRAGEQDRRAALAVPGVVAVQKDTLNQPLDDNTSFIGATNVWPTLGGSGQCRLERRRRRDRHGRLARAPR